MSCRTCGGQLAEVLDLGETPLADHLSETPDPGPLHRLRLAVCVSCWLVQLQEFVADDALYGGSYAFYSGASGASLIYFAEYARWAHALAPEGLVIEIACNDGTLLQHFARLGRSVLGIDPAHGPIELARDRGLNVLQASFNSGIAAHERGTAALVVANNVLAHVQDPRDFLRGVKTLLMPGGLAIIEVQYLGDLLLGNAFDQIYHQHRYYFSETSLLRLAAQEGLFAAQTLHTPAQGGSLRVVLTAATTGVTPRDEGWLRRWATFSSFSGRVEWWRARFLELLATLPQPVAGWAAPAKGTTLLSYCGLGPEQISHLVDTTDFKWHRYLCGIPVVSPGEREEPGTYLVLAHNYLATALRRERDYMARGGKLLVPLPLPQVI